jgi:hypothetical protein
MVDKISGTGQENVMASAGPEAEALINAFALWRHACRRPIGERYKLRHTRMLTTSCSPAGSAGLSQTRGVVKCIQNAVQIPSTRQCPQLKFIASRSSK